MSEENREISAIDTIYLLKDLIERLDKKIDILDGNLKLANNKISKLQKMVTNLTLVEANSVEKNKEKEIVPNQIIRTGKRSNSYIAGPIRTFGKIVSKELKPIQDVQVAIFNDENEVIKTRKTDSKGYWEVRLPSGKFGVQYTHKKFKPINLTIELDDNITEYEVK